MEIKINVMLDVTQRLENLAQTALTALLRQRESKVGESVSREQKREETAPQPMKAVLPEAPEPETTPEVPEPEPETPVAPEPETTPEAPVAPEPQPEAPAEPEPESAIPDDQTMRTLMDIAICHWAGLGSENSKDPETLRKRKDVCNAFKQIARHLGAEKPTKLEGDARNKFLHEIENNLYFCGDGKIEWRPF